MIVAAARITLLIHGNNSLKGKRQVVRSLIEKVRHRFSVSIAEVDSHDLWQRAVLGVCKIGTDVPHVDGTLRQVVRFIEDMQIAELGEDHIEVLHC